MFGLLYRGSYSEALSHYEKGYKDEPFTSIEGKEFLNETPELKEHTKLCIAGIARTSIRTGDFRRGVSLIYF